MTSKSSIKLWIFVAACFASYTEAFWCDDSSDCHSIGHICCNNNCVFDTNCIGYSCILDSDCQTLYSYLSCCDGTCQYECYIDNTGVIVGSTVGSVTLIILISLCVWCCCRRTSPSGGRILVGNQQRINVTTTTSNYTHPSSYPPPQQGHMYQGQPYNYQQGHAQPPPMQDGGYGTLDPRPGGYQAGPPGMGATGAPPPYEAHDKGTV